LITSTLAHAAPPEPSGAHPRLLLDAALKAAWRASKDRGPVKGAITLCEHARDTGEHDRAVYMGSEWAKVLQACLVAWAATDDASYAKTATRFFTALLDDLDRTGDGQGGDSAVRRDSGYPIRVLGPSTAIAYDWLYAQLSPELKAKARQRFAAWLDWYREHGYRAREPGNNYQAGYLVSATLIAVAQGSEAGDAGKRLWRHVSDELWTKDMAAALAPGGILDGGDWPEGWQYGPLAVTSYALAARVARRAGIPVEGVDRWLDALLKRHVYALSPGDRVYPGGDTEAETPNMDPHVNTLNAIALGDASPESKKWAKGELSRLRLTDADSLLIDALATVGDKPALVPRATWPTWYVAPATGTLYARTRWDDKAVWFVAECAPSLPVDHRHPSVGTFVLSRGKDDAIVDPSPYGSASTLTSNAPTVASAHLPADYIPSQGAWGEKSGWDYATQTRSGVVTARCDYADQYRFQERASDVPEAARDFVLLPSSDGSDAALVVIDRANTTNAARAMYLRFHAPAGIEVSGDAGTATIGATQLRIATVVKTGGTAAKGHGTGKDCFAEGIKKGQCEAARFPATDYRITIPGPRPLAVHAISVSGGEAAKVEKLGDGALRITGPRDAVVAWTPSYRAPRGANVTHVVLAAQSVTATRDGDTCAVTATPGKASLVVTLDDSCASVVEASSTGGAILKARPLRASPTPSAPRASGCCGAQASPASSFAMMFVVAFVLRRPIRRARRRSRSAPSSRTSA
jgi:hypothetical protein